MSKDLTVEVPGDFQTVLTDELDRCREKRVVSRIWAKDSSVWTDSGEGKWLGWLDISTRELDELDKYEPAVRAGSEFDHIVLLGMGGSSLCPDVLSKVFGKNKFQVVDSTVPEQLLRIGNSLNYSSTLFIVASKSGTTLEPNIFLDYFFEKVKEAVGDESAGRHFIAITDPGSALDKRASREEFLRVFKGDPEIGGRFSALSVFGITPAAVMGVDYAAILENADDMSGNCRRNNPEENAGALLGCVMSAALKSHRDKLEILASPGIVSMGAWLEQLIAESTGKNGKAVIPVDLRGNCIGGSMRKDRVLVYLRLASGVSAEQEEFVRGLKASGEPVITVDIEDLYEIGAEFFKWEFATAVLGALMEINPFDQPDVESAKVEARKITDAFEETGELPSEDAFYEADGIKLFTNKLNRVALGDHHQVPAYVRSLFNRLAPGDYATILAYVDMNNENGAALERFRKFVAEKYSVSTTVQYGPRFLHSTGQAFKGGPSNGVFLQISQTNTEDAKVPGKKYSFGVVKEAQARGDFQILLDRERRALRMEVEGDLPRALASLTEAIS